MEKNLVGKWLGEKYDSQFESKEGVDRLSKWKGVSPQSVVEAQPLATDYEFEDFNKYLRDQGRIDPVYGDIEEQRAQAQSDVAKLSMMLPRIGAKIVTETAKIPGEVAGLIEWGTTGFDIDKFSDSVDNAWVRAIDNAAEYVNEDILSVYKRREVEQGGFWRQITSPEFWATEGADGIGFLAAMMVPGALLRSAGLGEGVIKGLTGVINKFGKAGKLSRAGMKAADNVNVWTSAGVNTLVESVAEGAENMKGTEQALFKKKLDELLATNQYDPQQASDLAQEYVKSPEVQSQISNGGYKTFMANLAILMGPNLLDQKWLFKGFSNLEAKGVIGSRMSGAVGKTTEDALESITRLTPKQIKGKVGKEFLLGVGKEGFFEEGLQYAASKQQEQKIIDPDNATNLLETYAEALSDTDMQKSIFLGAMLGGVMGSVGGYRSAKREDEYLFGSEGKEFSKFRKFLGAKDTEPTKGVIDVFKNNFVKRYQSVNDLYKTKTVNGKEELELDEKGNPVIDTEKITKYGSQLINDAVLKEKLKDAADRGDKEGYEYLKSIMDFQYIVPFVTEEGGYELLKQHINNLAEKDLQELAQSGMYDAELTNDEVKQDLLKKAAKINNLVKKADKDIIRLFSTNKENEKYARGYMQELYDSYISSEYQKDFINTRLSDLNSLSNHIISESLETEVVNIKDTSVGDIVVLDGEKQQIIDKKDNNLKTINLDGDIKDKDISTITDKVEKVKNIHPITRDSLGEILFNKNFYKKDLNNLVANQEKLFNKKGQQQAFEEYTQRFNKIIKDAEKIPTTSVKEELTNTETIEDLETLKGKITDSTEISDKNKKDLVKETEAKIRAKEAEKAKLEAERKAKEKPVEPVTEETVGGVITTEDLKKQAKPLEQIHEVTTEEPVEYDIDRKQEGRGDKLDASEDQLAESEFKTTYVNVAYLAIEYDEKNGTIRSKLDANKKLVFNTEEQSLSSIPGEYTPGTEMVMFVYEGHDELTKGQYEAYKDDVDNIPIAIQKLEDYNAGKQPFLFVHKMNWITPNRVAEHSLEQVTTETKALREFVVKNGATVTTLVDKSGGWINKPPKGTKNPNYYSIREIIGNDTRPVIGFGDKLGNLDANIEAENSHNVVSGIPYLVLPRANNTNFAIWLKQEAIKNNPNFSKYTQTVTKIFEEYVKDTIDIKSLKELREEIGKYFHVNTDSLSDDLLKNEKKEYIFRISENDKSQPRITLITQQGLQDYYFIKNKQGEWNWVASKGGKTTTIKNMAEELGSRIGNKYPNITKKGVEAGSEFEVYELQGENLVKVKKDYIDFLSDNRVVTSTVQPRVINGVRTYFSQPNIRINTDINQMKVLRTAEKQEKSYEEKVTDIERRRQEELLKRVPKKEELYKDDEGREFVVTYTNNGRLKLSVNTEVGTQHIAEYSAEVPIENIIHNATLVGEFNRETKQKFIDKINAKYDAELAELEKQQKSLEITEKIPTFEELFPEGLPTDINIDEIFSEQDKKDAEDIMKHCQGKKTRKNIKKVK